MIEIILWRILRYSGVFRWWAERFFSELLLDLEIADLTGPTELKEKYLKRLETIRKGTSLFGRR